MCVNDVCVCDKIDWMENGWMDWIEWMWMWMDVESGKWIVARFRISHLFDVCQEENGLYDTYKMETSTFAMYTLEKYNTFYMCLIFSLILT